MLDSAAATQSHSVAAAVHNSLAMLCVPAVHWRYTAAEAVDTLAGSSGGFGNMGLAG